MVARTGRITTVVVLVASLAGWLLAGPSPAWAAGPIWYGSPGWINVFETGAISDVECWEVNGDGHYDLIATCANTSYLHVYTNDGDGTYTLFSSSGTASHGQPLTLAVGDFDGNGTKDHVVGTTGGWIRRTFGESNGSIDGAEQWVSLGAADKDPHDIETLYLAGDVRQGVVVSIPSHDELKVFENDGDGNFALKTTVTMPAGSEPRGVAIGNFDGDDRDDIAVAAHGTDMVYIYRQLADGTFVQAVGLQAGDGPWDVVGDSCGVGPDDVVVTNRHAGTVTIRKSDSGGSWLAPITRTVGGEPVGIFGAKLDLSDEYCDFAVVDVASHKIRFLQNDASRSFTVQTYAPDTYVDAIGVGIAEANDDAKYDLITWGGDRIYIYPGEGWPSAERWQGADRYATSAAVSQKLFGTASTVVIATGETFPDALSGAPLAGMLKAPILLTRRADLPEVVADEIDRLGAGTAYILGSTSAVSGAVEADLHAMGVVTVHRLGGANRYETSKLIAQKMEDLEMADIDTAFITTGENFPDGLAVGSLAAAWKMPILLVRRDSIPPETQQAITGLGLTDTYVLGSTAAVGSGVYGDLPNPTRLQGADRYETAVAIANWGVANGASREILLLATGENFPDALAMGAVGAAEPAVMLLTRRSSVPAATASYAAAYGREVSAMFVAGSTAAISEPTVEAIRTGY